MARKKHGPSERLAAIRAGEEPPAKDAGREPGSDGAIVEANVLLFPGKRDGSFVRVFRRGDIEKDWVFHGKLSPDEATEERVGDLFGGGFYKLMCFERNEIGQYVFGGQTTVRLPGKYKQPMSELPGVASNGGTAAAAGAGTPEVGHRAFGADPLHSALVGSVVNLLERLQIPHSPAEPLVKDWTPIITAVTGLLATVLTKLVERPKGDDALTERLRVLEEHLVKLQQQPTPATNAISDAAKAIKDLLAVKDMIEGGDERKAARDPEAMMFDAIPRLLQAMGAKTAAPAPAAVPALADPNMPQWQRLLLSQRATLVRFARMGVLPETAADLAIQMMPKQVEGVVAEFIARPDCSAITMQVIPELAEFPTFVQGFYAEAGRLLRGEEETEEGETDDQRGGP